MPENSLVEMFGQVSIAILYRAKFESVHDECKLVSVKLHCGYLDIIPS